MGSFTAEASRFRSNPPRGMLLRTVRVGLSLFHICSETLFASVVWVFACWLVASFSGRLSSLFRVPLQVFGMRFLRAFVRYLLLLAKIYLTLAGRVGWPKLGFWLLVVICVCLRHPSVYGSFASEFPDEEGRFRHHD